MLAALAVADSVLGVASTAKTARATSGATSLNELEVRLPPFPSYPMSSQAIGAAASMLANLLKGASNSRPQGDES